MLLAGGRHALSGMAKALALCGVAGPVSALDALLDLPAGRATSGAAGVRGIQSGPTTAFPAAAAASPQLEHIPHVPSGGGFPGVMSLVDPADRSRSRDRSPSRRKTVPRQHHRPHRHSKPSTKSRRGIKVARTFVQNYECETDRLIDLQARHTAMDTPAPIVLQRAEGPYVWDLAGHKYFDFNCGYSAANQGHRHPRIVAAAKQQLDRATIVSDAFYNDVLPVYAEHITRLMGFDRVLPMNTGAEALETALKLARKWGYMAKGVPEGTATTLFCRRNFHGRSMGAVSASTQPRVYAGFAPLMSGFDWVPFNDAAALREKLAANPSIVAFFMEPIQGEAGVVLPDEGYLSEVRAACDDFGVLLVADEVQTGLGRTGRMLACDHEGVAPDVLLLGKSLSGGLLPVSAVLANDPVMAALGQKKEHGSTFGGNPLACAVATEALKVTVEEELPQRAEVAGRHLRGRLAEGLPEGVALRGRGLMNAIELDRSLGISGAQLCGALRESGLLAMPVQENVVRLYPPLTVGAAEVEEAAGIITATLHRLTKLT